MIQAVVVIARVVFRHHKVNRGHPVEGVLEIRGVPAARTVSQPAAVMPGATGVVGVHVVGLEAHTAEEVHDAARGQPEEIRVRDVVAAQRLRGAPRRIERRDRSPPQGIAGLREPVIDTPLHSVLRIQREVAAVREREERGARVVVLLQVAMQHRMPRNTRREVVDRYLHVAPVGITIVAIVPHGAHRSDDEFVVVHDGPLVHEPRPCSVVVQLDQWTGYVIDREVAPTRGADDQQTSNRQTHARYRSLIKGSSVSSGIFHTASFMISTSIGPAA